MLAARAASAGRRSPLEEGSSPGNWCKYQSRVWHAQARVTHSPAAARLLLQQLLPWPTQHACAYARVSKEASDLMPRALHKAI